MCVSFLRWAKMCGGWDSDEVVWLSSSSIQLSNGMYGSQIWMDAHSECNVLIIITLRRKWRAAGNEIFSCFDIQISSEARKDTGHQFSESCTYARLHRLPVLVFLLDSTAFILVGLVFRCFEIDNKSKIPPPNLDQVLHFLTVETQDGWNFRGGWKHPGNETLQRFSQHFNTFA